MSMAAGPCTDMAINVTPLSPALGAEITGVDLGRDIGAETFAAIHAAWLEYLVLVFPGQDLSADAQVCFTEKFGALGLRRSQLGDDVGAVENRANANVAVVRDNDAGDGVAYVASSRARDPAEHVTVYGARTAFHDERAIVRYVIEYADIAHSRQNRTARGQAQAGERIHGTVAGLEEVEGRNDVNSTFKAWESRLRRQNRRGARGRIGMDGQNPANVLEGGKRAGALDKLLCALHEVQFAAVQAVALAGVVGGGQLLDDAAQKRLKTEGI